MLTAALGSRDFSSALEIRTAAGTFKVEEVLVSPFCSETHLLDPSGNQVARMQAETCLSNVCNIIITGGGSFQLRDDPDSSRSWIRRLIRENSLCTGEGRTLHISQKNSRTFIVSDDTGEIATCSKPGYFDDYTVTVQNDSDLKLIICIFVSLCRDQLSTDFSVTML